MSARILICYLVKNSGHHTAACAVELALSREAPDAQILTVDLLRYIHPRTSRLIQKTYMTTIKRTPEIWDALYDKAVIELLTRRVRRLLQHGRNRMLLQLMDDFRPHAVVSTQAHPFAVICSYEREHRRNIPVWGVVTDFVPHRFWVVEDIGCYVVPTESARDRLRWLGVPADRISVLGIPVNVEIAEQERRALGRDGESRVLVMGGGRGLGVGYSTVKNIDRSHGVFTIDVVTGTNRKLRRKLVMKRHAFKHRIRVRGYVRHVPVLMYNSKVLVSKPGGLTSAEALAVGLPMVIVRPLPGQERGNARFLTAHGAAVQLRSERDAAPVISALLSNSTLLEMMREKARSLGRPTAARDIARAVLRSIA
ncbi:MAG TPA: hypothetical protein EYP62_08575 [Kiritimatiellae bacterium]|nr:hypothetical protein [Kiritimatiellia bacterium]